MDSQQPESINLSKDGYSTLQRGAARLGMVVDGALDEFFSHKDQKPGWLRDAIAADPGIKIMFDREAIREAVVTGQERWNHSPGVLADRITDAIMELLARKWEQGDG